MRHNFERWMANIKRYVPGTVKRDAKAIDKISQHYSEETGKPIDVYKINDIVRLKSICKDYCEDGKFYDFGNIYHGLYRCAICAYVRYYEWQKRIS